MILLTVGQPGAGKTSLCDYLAKKYDFSVFLISDLIRDYAKSHGLPLATRQDYIAAHTVMLGEKGKYIVTDHVLQSSARRICVDGIRVPAHITKLKAHGAKVLAFDCPAAIRFARAIGRNRPLDPTSFEAFMADEEKEATNTDPFIQNTRQALTMADYTLNTSAPLRQVLNDLDNVVQKILRRA